MNTIASMAARFGALLGFVSIAVFSGYVPASATEIVVGAGWSATTTVPPAFFWGPTPEVGPNFSGSGPFTFTSAGPTTVSVTDDFCQGDRFRIYDNGVAIGETSDVAVGDCGQEGDGLGPDAAFANPTFSSGTFLLGAGAHSLAIEIIANPFFSGRGYIRVDAVPAPVATNDAYSTNEDTALSIAVTGVLANDTGGSLTAELVAPSEHGTVTLNADGSFTYVPNPNFNGPDSFLYVAKNGPIESNIATVTITVGAVNDPPFFNPIPDQFVSPPLSVNQTVDITDVAPGPVNESEQGLTLTAVSSNTALISNPTISGDGSARTLTYQRVGSSSGTATITVTAQDNGGTANGGADTFSRTFDITLEGVAAVQAILTSFSPNPDPTKAPTVTVTVTAGPIDFNGNGAIDCPGDAYRFFPPRPAPGQPFNVIPSNADRVPEAPPWRIPDDTVEVCNATVNFTAVLDLSDWKTGPTGSTDIAYVSIVRDPELSPTGECPDGASCFQRIWTGVIPVGSITFDSADTVGVKTTVTLKTSDTVKKTSTSTRLALVPIRVFDIRNPELQAVASGAIKSATEISFSELSKVLGTIFEADKGRIGTCQTDDNGVCFASQAAPTYDLIIAKFFDDDTGQTVYVGDIKGPNSFVDGIAASNLVIVKVFKKGVFQGYASGILQHVKVK